MLTQRCLRIASLVPTLVSALITTLVASIVASVIVVAASTALVVALSGDRDQQWEEEHQRRDCSRELHYV